jgi:ribosomal-protein-alanine N-acetyltransferase
MPPIEPIRTPRLVLRDFVAGDWPAVHRYASDPLVTRYMTFPPNATEAVTREVVEGMIAQQAEEPRSHYELGMMLAATGELVGTAGIRWESPNNREASMGYILRRDCWGKGYTTEAAQALLRLGFELMGAHRVFATCDIENLASARVLEKIGMTLEGTHRQDVWSPANIAWRDSHYYAILEDEWKRLHRR